MLVRYFDRVHGVVHVHGVVPGVAPGVHGIDRRVRTAPWGSWGPRGRLRGVYRLRASPGRPDVAAMKGAFGRLCVPKPAQHNGAEIAPAWGLCVKAQIGHHFCRSRADLGRPRRNRIRAELDPNWTVLSFFLVSSFVFSSSTETAARGKPPAVRAPQRVQGVTRRARMWAQQEAGCLFIAAPQAQRQRARRSARLSRQEGPGSCDSAGLLPFPFLSSSPASNGSTRIRCAGIRARGRRRRRPCCP